MIVAITGGTGFIGRHLIARHCLRGDQVRFLTRQHSTKGIVGATAFVGSLDSNADVLGPFVRGADVLYHCAAELRNEVEMHNTNVCGTENLIAAANGEIGRWVQLSSTGVYGRHRAGVQDMRGDIDEDAIDENAIDENAIARPTNKYESSKLASDNLVQEAAAQHGFAAVVVRPSNVYGIDMPNQSLFQLIRMIDRGWFFFIGPEGASANYVPVENVIDALLLCATAKLSENGRAYIVSDHRSLEALVQIIASALKKKPPKCRFPEPLIRIANAIIGKLPGFPLSTSRIDALTDRSIYRIDRIQSELGFENRVSMEAGMGELVRQYQHSRAGT